MSAEKVALCGPIKLYALLYYHTVQHLMRYFVKYVLKDKKYI